jgi:hypothetical protein
LQFDPAAREKLINLLPLHAANIAVGWIVNMIVIPQNEAIFLEHPEHLGSHPLFHAGVQNRSEDCGLQDQIKCLVRERQLCRPPTPEVNRFWA